MQLLRTAAGVVCVASSVTLCTIALYSSDVLLPGQKVNGVECAWKARDDVLQEMRKSAATPLTLTVNGEDLIYTKYSQPVYNSNDVQQSFFDWVSRKPIVVEIKTVYDKHGIEEMLNSLYEESSDAEIVWDGAWTLLPENTGYDFNIDVALSDLVESREHYVDIDAMVSLPKVTEKDLQKRFDSLVWMNDFDVMYSNGKSINGESLAQYVVNYVLKLPEDFFENAVKWATESYNTTEEIVQVKHPVTGDTITAKRKTLKQSVNMDKEVQFLQNAIEEHESVEDRVPVLSGYETIGDTYILVSIDEQHLWYVKGGELHSETDVVTGRKGVHDTPRGAYYISECIPGKNLRGTGYVTWVNQWMRLTNAGIGLHDAYWRGSFGKNIYTYNGSHGCINLPKAFAKELYNDAYVGLPVIVY